MQKYFISIFSAIVLGAVSSWAGPVKIAAAIPDIGSIASYIGGDKVEVFSIARNTANPHFVEVLPSYMIKVSRAALYLKAGLALDQWSDQIIDGSRNSTLLVTDCSTGITVLQKPAGKVDASMGDVHAEGNPHYWLDPGNGIIIADNVLAALKNADPAHSGYYDENYSRFKREAAERIAVWQRKMMQLGGQKIVSYHSSWVYFAHAFNLNIAANVEPLPGIPPTGKHLAEVVAIIRNNHINMLLQEPYFSDSAPQFLCRQTGIRVFKFAPSCAGIAANDYFSHFDDMIGQLTQE